MFSHDSITMLNKNSTLFNLVCQWVIFIEAEKWKAEKRKASHAIASQFSQSLSTRIKRLCIPSLRHKLVKQLEPTWLDAIGFRGIPFLFFLAVLAYGTMTRKRGCTVEPSLVTTSASQGIVLC